MKKTRMIAGRLVCLVVIFLVFAVNSFAQERTKEVGVVEYKKFQWEKTETSYKYYTNYTKPLFKIISDLGYSPEWTTMDIFLNKAKRDKYKRIVISFAASYFTPEMYHGMKDYITRGGLLITNSSLISIDANRNYKADKEDYYLKGSGHDFISGVRGVSVVHITKIKVETSCPLTEGLPVSEWMTLKTKLSGRMIKNYKEATVLITSDSIYKDKPHNNQPFLIYKRTGEGACIYIVPTIGSGKGKYISLILKNALSKEVLNWLTSEGVL